MFIVHRSAHIAVCLRRPHTVYPSDFDWMHFMSGFLLGFVFVYFSFASQTRPDRNDYRSIFIHIQIQDGTRRMVSLMKANE